MLAMVAALPKDLGGLGAGAIYIDTEGAFSSERWVVTIDACNFVPLSVSSRYFVPYVFSILRTLCLLDTLCCLYIIVLLSLPVVAFFIFTLKLNISVDYSTCVFHVSRLPLYL